MVGPGAPASPQAPPGDASKRKAGSPPEGAPAAKRGAPDQAPDAAACEERRQELAEVYAAYAALTAAAPGDTPPEQAFLRLLQAAQGAPERRGQGCAWSAAPHTPPPAPPIPGRSKRAAGSWSSLTHPSPHPTLQQQAQRAAAAWRRACCLAMCGASRSTATPPPKRSPSWPGSRSVVRPLPAVVLPLLLGSWACFVRQPAANQPKLPSSHFPAPSTCRPCCSGASARRCRSRAARGGGCCQGRRRAAGHNQAGHLLLRVSGRLLNGHVCSDAVHQLAAPLARARLLQPDAGQVSRAPCGAGCPTH